MRKTSTLIVAAGLMAAVLALPGTALGRAAFTEYTATETQIGGPNFDPATDWTKPVVQTRFESVFVDDAIEPFVGASFLVPLDAVSDKIEALVDVGDTGFRFRQVQTHRGDHSCNGVTDTLGVLLFTLDQDHEIVRISNQAIVGESVTAAL